MEKSGDITPAYNAKNIMNNINMLVTQEDAFERLFKARKVTPVRISYESMMMDKCATVALFSDALGVGADAEIVDSEVIKKISGDLNVEFEEKFRREEGVFLEDVLRNRMTVMSILKTVWSYYKEWRLGD